MLLVLLFTPQIAPEMAFRPIYAYGVPIALGLVVQSSLYDVKGGSRAVIFDRFQGVKETVINEGTHLLLPWVQKAVIFDVRTKPRNISTTTGSKDLQMVSLTLRVLHRPEVKMLPKIYQVRVASERMLAFRAELDDRTSAWITTSASFPPSATKS